MRKSLSGLLVSNARHTATIHKIALKDESPTEVDDLVGDASKAHRKLGWRSETSFAELVAEMVNSDLKAVAEEAGRKDRGSY